MAAGPAGIRGRSRSQLGLVRGLASSVLRDHSDERVARCLSPLSQRQRGRPEKSPQPGSGCLGDRPLHIARSALSFYERRILKSLRSSCAVRLLASRAIRRECRHFLSHVHEGWLLSVDENTKLPVSHCAAQPGIMTRGRAPLQPGSASRSSSSGENGALPMASRESLASPSRRSPRLVGSEVGCLQSRRRWRRRNGRTLRRLLPTSSRRRRGSRSCR